MYWAGPNDMTCCLAHLTVVCLGLSITGSISCQCQLSHAELTWQLGVVFVSGGPLVVGVMTIIIIKSIVKIKNI